MSDAVVTAGDEEFRRAAAFRSELRRFLRRTEVVTAEAGLTPQRYDVLLMVKSADPAVGIRVTELCALLQLGQTAVTELVKRMEGAGLLERRGSSEDRRVTLLGLTEQGEARLVAVFQALQQDRAALAEVFAQLDALFRDSSV